MGTLSRKTNHTYAAKPTTYRGTTYRSKLEARWAVLFDVLGLPFEYEPKCFRTPEGGYLPDFYVLAPRPFWLEIKGPEPIERDYVRARHVVKQTKAKFRFLVGPLPAAPSRGILRTRILRGETWRPADWRVPTTGLDAALTTASSYDFEGFF
jgi:hypothetical protein